MKKILFLGILICLAFSQTSFAQVTAETMVGTWRIVDFNMVPKKANGKLTKKEIETVEAMKKALTLNPKFMTFILDSDGTALVSPNPNPDRIQPTWEFKDSIFTFKYYRRKSEQYKIKLLEDGRTEWQAVKSKVAFPVMTFEKD
jgi:hypothetical protein